MSKAYRQSFLVGALLLSVSAVFLPLHCASAAELVDVIDAGDPEDPFDLRVEVNYLRSLRRAKGTREFHCAQGEFAAAGGAVDPCPGADAYGALLHVKELRYERETHGMLPTIRIGLWHDLELKVEAPVILSDEQGVRYAGNGGNKNGVIVTEATSTIAPEQGTPRLFGVPPTGAGALPNRSGFGDMLFMLRYSPLSQDRDPQRATWTLELGYRAPTGEPMKFGNTGVGRGVHELELATGLSRRFAFADPYLRLAAVLPFAASDSLFKDYGFAQDYIGPGNRVSLQLGSEFIPYQDPETGAKLFFDIGFSSEYQAKGRDYSELFDAIAGSQTQTACADGNIFDDRGAQGRLPNVACFNPASSSVVCGQPLDGITTVEPFMTFGLNLGAGIYATDSAKISVDLALAHETEHFIGTADLGDDLDGSGEIEPVGNPAEQNPTFSPAIDELGRRIRIEETTVFSVGVSLALML